MDNFLLKENNYKKKTKYDKDIIKPKEDAIVIKQPNDKNLLFYDDKTQKQKQLIELTSEYKIKEKGDIKINDFTYEKYKIKEKGDIKLNEWIKKQKDPLIVFISDIIPETNILSHLERIRPIIKTTSVMSIEEYRKRKKIGEEGVIYLKKLKEKYGNIILKTLWASLNLN
jgi:hypothetical protein